MAPKILLALLIAAAVNCTAQDTTKNSQKIPPAFWGELGGGTSSLGGFSGTIYGNAQITQKLVITAGLQGESNQGASLLNFSAREEQDLNSMGLLIGRIYKQQYSMVIISVGLSYVQYQDKNLTGLFASTPDVIINKYTIGVPVLIRAYWVMGQCIGLGAGVYGNFNGQQSTGGVSLSLAFGRIQTHPERRNKAKGRDPLHLFN